MLNRSQHELILNNIVKDVYGDRFLAPILGFKGGTACYLFYNLPRFSTDLDFNLLDKKETKEVLERFKKILTKYGIVKESGIKRNTIFLLLSYEKKSQNVKIEISLRDYGNNYKIINYFGISVLVMRRENMFAHKLVAISERRKIANRDLFDVHFFLENNWPMSEKIIRARTGKDVKEHIKNLISFINAEISNRNILFGLGEILDEKQKKWVKTNLKKETIFLLNVYLKNL